jgi:hypothetical protein
MAKIPAAFSGRAGKKNKIKLALQRREAKRKAASMQALAPIEDAPSTAPAPAPEPAPAPIEEPEPIEEAPAPEPEPIEEPEPAEEAPEYSMINTKAELVQAAKDAGVEIKSTSTKAEILQALYPEN